MVFPRTFHDCGRVNRGTGSLDAGYHRFDPFAADSGAIIGTAVSGTFLWLLGLMNIVIVLGIYHNGLPDSHLRSGRARFQSALENPGQAWLSQSILFPAFQNSEAAVAHLSHWCSLWTGIRYCQRDHPNSNKRGGREFFLPQSHSG